MASSYTFLPWLRRGLAKKISEPDPLTNAPASTPNASVMVGVKLLADDLEKQTISHQTILLGPGDIIGIERDAIVKTEPRAGIVNFEPTYFPYIEFYEEDLPWRYTPAQAAKGIRLRPWLALIVLEAPEFERRNPVNGGPNPVVLVKEAFLPLVFPPSTQTWAWAHVQVNDNTLDLSDPTKRDLAIGDALTRNPNVGSSRLMCPRRLRPNTQYYAFLIPSFEKGRVAGLNGTQEKIDAAGRFEAAWGNEQTFMPGHYPIYYEWPFRTGDADVETLAEKIKPQDLKGLDVGKLWMDVEDIGYGKNLEYHGNLDPANPDRQGVMPFEGALRMVGPETPTMVQRPGADEKTWVGNLAALLNLGTQYRTTSLATLAGFTQNVIWQEQDDPLLVPPIYGRWYAQQDGSPTLKPAQQGNWLEQLNLDPAYRAAAGLGAEVVRQHQDEFVGRAWEQFSMPRRNLNIELLRLRFAQEVTHATYAKHFAVSATPTEAAINRQIALTNTLHSVVTLDGGTSLAATLSGLKGETMFVEPAYRRLTRTNGSLMKRLNQPNLYNRVVMASAWKFQISVLTVAASQPFQNFDSVLTRAIDPEKIRTANFSLTRPNWFDLHVANISLGSRDPFKNAFAVLKKSVMLRPIQRSLPTAPDTTRWSASIQQKISPSISFYKKFVNLTAVSVSSTPLTTVTDEGTISPNSFNPIFSEPTYSYIAQLQPELFIPNLDQIKPDSAVVLQANSRFIEAYLAGLNQEMAVELLWRGFPADMNATFFRQFWDVSERTSVVGSDQSDILPIRQWAPTKALGTNGPLGSVPNPLVLVIKAELIKKYPTIAVYAHRAQKGADGFRRPDPAADAIKTPIFMAQLDPDFLLSGFALTADQVLGKSGGVDKDGWYFVLAERPGDMHFGMDLDGSQAPATWNDLHWGLLPPNVTMLDLDIHKPTEPTTNRSIHWGKGLNATADEPTSGTGDAAQMASILQQKPFRVFFHASTLLPNS